MSGDKKELTGGCLCGAIRYRVEGSPKRVSNCYCGMCQRANGAAFATGAAFEPDKLMITKGEPKAYASSEEFTRLFCPDCGSPIGYRYTDGEAAGIWVPTLDEPEALPPIRHIWTSSKLSWVHTDDGLPTFAEGVPRPGARD